MASLVDRIIQFLESKGENISSFSARCGLANGALNKAQKKNGGLSAESIKRILLANPNLSADWLFDRPSGEKGFLSEPEEKYLRPNALPQDQADWVVEIKQEMQELRGRIQELERKAKDR
jgi:transcriptional regulator with XRE-family HTH domain